jgi:hypothetical protein
MIYITELGFPRVDVASSYSNPRCSQVCLDGAVNPFKKHGIPPLNVWNKQVVD